MIFQKLQRDIFPVVLKTSEVVLYCFAHVKINQVLCRIVKQRLGVTSSPLFKEEPRYLLSDGQNSDFPLGRIAIALGRNWKNHSRIVAQRGMSRYVFLI
jgi:hypothetical protein